jgi:hypothetical protein
MKKWTSFLSFKNRVLQWLLRGVLILALIGGVLAGVLYLGQVSLESLRGEDRYRVAFQDMECQPPAGMSRVDFLDEVQYLASVPSELQLLDEELPVTLAAAFARHPWVREVAEVRVLPQKKIRVALVYRTPVLAVRWNGSLRAVDGAGVLLPANASTKGLPVFSGKALPPRGAAGHPWGDPAVEKAAQEAGRSTSAANKN